MKFVSRLKISAQQKIMTKSQYIMVGQSGSWKACQVFSVKAKDVRNYCLLVMSASLVQFIWTEITPKYLYKSFLEQLFWIPQIQVYRCVGITFLFCMHHWHWWMAKQLNSKSDPNILNFEKNSVSKWSLNIFILNSCMFRIKLVSTTSSLIRWNGSPPKSFSPCLGLPLSVQTWTLLSPFVIVYHCNYLLSRNLKFLFVPWKRILRTDWKSSILFDIYFHCIKFYDLDK